MTVYNFLLATCFFKNRTMCTGFTLAFANQHKYSVTALQIAMGAYCMWKFILNNEMQSSNVQNCVFRLSKDELSWAFIHPGNVFAEQACSFAYLFSFSSALLHSSTLIYIYSRFPLGNCKVQPQCCTVGCWAASLGHFSVKCVAQKHLSST